MKKKNRHTKPAGASGPVREGGAAAASTPARQLADEAEPTASRKGVPVLMIVILGLLLYWGDMYLMENGADVMGKTGSFPAQLYEPFRTLEQVSRANPTTPGRAGFEKGLRLYKMYCAPCHQESGQGNASTFVPPLAESEWVLAEGPNRIIRIVLNGLKGPITVNGKEYGGNEMLPWRDSIPNDEDVAAILTYIRQDWGNKASEVKAEQVKALREETKDRGSNWTAPELLGFPVK